MVIILINIFVWLIDYDDSTHYYHLSLPLWLQPPNWSMHYRDLFSPELHWETVFDS